MLIENRTPIYLNECNIFVINDVIKKQYENQKEEKEKMNSENEADYLREIFRDWVLNGFFDQKNNTYFCRFENFKASWLENSETVFEKIKGLKNIECTSKKKTQYSLEHKRTDSFKIPFKFGLTKIPLNKKLLNNDEFLDKFYIILYLYKCLKKYRNTVAHPEIIDSKKDFSANEVKAWIQLYLECLDNLVVMSKDIFEEEKNNKPLATEEMLKQLQEKMNKR